MTEKKRWLVVSKLRERIWQILTWALESLKNLQFNSLLLTKVYNVWAKKVQGSYVWWHWRLIQNLKEKWLLLPKMTWGIWQIWTRALQGLKIRTFMGSFHQKWKLYDLKTYRGVMWHDNEQWCKNVKRNWLVSPKLTREIYRILTRALKNLRHVRFNELLLTKECNVWA